MVHISNVLLVWGEGVGILTMTPGRSLVHTFTILLGMGVPTQDVSRIHTVNVLFCGQEGAEFALTQGLVHTSDALSDGKVGGSSQGSRVLSGG